MRSPTISRLVGCQTAANGSVTGCSRGGGDTVQVWGANFVRSASAMSILTAVLFVCHAPQGPNGATCAVGGAPCRRVIYFNHSLLNCVLEAGTGFDRLVLVQVRYCVDNLPRVPKDLSFCGDCFNRR